VPLAFPVIDFEEKLAIDQRFESAATTAGFIAS
jgi:hypothetical protein